MRPVFIVNNPGNGDAVREGGSHLHTVVIPLNTTCSHCDQHYESVAMLLEHLRTEFPLDQRYAELGLDAGAGNAGGEATETEALSRRTGAAEPRHTEADAYPRELQAATFRTMLVKYDGPLEQASKAATGLFVTKSKEGQRPTGEPLALPGERCLSVSRLASIDESESESESS